MVRAGIAAVLMFILAGCSGPDRPTTNPVRKMDAAGFEHVISDRNFSGLVVVFASWCPPCREELPDVARIYRHDLPQGVKIVALSLDEGDDKAVQRLVNELELPFPVYQVGMQAAAHFRIIGVPTVMWVRQGRIVEKTPGRQSPSQLVNKLKTLGGS